MHSLCHMLGEIEKEIDDLPPSLRIPIEPLIERRNVGQVTSIDEALAYQIQCAFVFFTGLEPRRAPAKMI